MHVAGARGGAAASSTTPPQPIPEWPVCGRRRGTGSAWAACLPAGSSSLGPSLLQRGLKRLVRTSSVLPPMPSGAAKISSGGNTSSQTWRETGRPATQVAHASGRAHVGSVQHQMQPWGASAAQAVAAVSIEQLAECAGGRGATRRTSALLSCSRAVRLSPYWRRSYCAPAALAESCAGITRLLAARDLHSGSRGRHPSLLRTFFVDAGYVLKVPFIVGLRCGPLLPQVHPAGDLPGHKLSTAPAPCASDSQPYSNGRGES